MKISNDAINIHSASVMRVVLLNEEIKIEPTIIHATSNYGIYDKMLNIHVQDSTFIGKATSIYITEEGYNKFAAKDRVTPENFNAFCEWVLLYNKDDIKINADGEYKLRTQKTEEPSKLGEAHLNLLAGKTKSEQEALVNAVKIIKELTKADAYYIVTLNNLLKRKHSTLENFLLRKEKCESLGLPVPENEGVRPKWADGTPAHYFYDTNEVYTYDISKGEFPLTTYRPQAWKNAIKEIFWIYQDQSNDLNVLETKYGIKWWEEWNIGDKTIGARYGATVKEYDLLNNTLNEIKNDPMSRRNIMDMLQYKNLKETPGLFPCCYSTTWNVRGEYLDVLVNQRSSDFATAWSINQIQYVALQMMLAKAAGLKPGRFTHVVANVHIYDRHLTACGILAGRTPTLGKNPILKFEPKSDNFYEFSINDFSVEDYEPHPEQIKLEIAI